MPANSAKAPSPLTVALIVYDDVKLLDVAGPLQVFSDARRQDGSAAYRLSLHAERAGTVATDTIVALSAAELRGAARAQTLIVAGGRGAFAARRSMELSAVLKRGARAGRRLCSVCLGAFILAEAGLLSGKRATTHWVECARLAREYPDIDVQADEIFIEHGDVWTSAGVSSGVDLALALVERDLGRKEALRIARLLVLPIKRRGGQSQFSAGLRQQVESAKGRFDALIAALHEDPGGAYTVPTMAARAHMSERNFARLFKAETGKTPARYVERVRVEASRDALLDQKITLKAAAARFGFRSEETMRRAYKRHLGVTPSNLVGLFVAEK
ncbi:MAG: helix-turn-helix domain-containing protein [Pseudomonadota bacterium]